MLRDPLLVQAALGGALDAAVRVRSRKAHAPVFGAMRELAAQYPRFGYRGIRVFLGRRGMAMSPDRAQRIWRSAELQVMSRAAVVSE